MHKTTVMPDMLYKVDLAREWSIYSCLPGFTKSARKVYIYKDPASCLSPLPASSPASASHLPNLAMPILQRHDCTHSCLPLPRINETAPMQDFHYKVDAAIKLDVIKTSSYSSDAKNHSRLQAGNK